MISDRYFIRAFSSFWNDVMPLCELLIRDINLHRYERVDSPIYATSNPDRRALINELAFEAFVRTWAKAKRRDLSKMIGTCTKEVWSRVKLFELGDKTAFPLPSVAEKKEAILLAEKLWKFAENRVSGTDGTFVSKPRIAGCGLLDVCEGDLIIGDTLFEVKAGDRSFRGIDLRQLAVYCALNSISAQYKFTKIGAYNPRHGTMFAIDLNEFCVRVSSVEASEMLGRIISFLSGVGISK